VCGRFTLNAGKSILASEFKIDPVKLAKMTASYNIAPSQGVAAVIEEGERKLEFMNWGLIPHWAKDPSVGWRMINARQETLEQKPSFKGPFKAQRCLIPASGFYEWKKEAREKVPYYIRLKSKRPFSFAGLWSDWSNSDGSHIRSCTIITGEPNNLIKPIHHRMPVILPESSREEWLDVRHFKPDALVRLLMPYPDDAMEAYPVSRYVNSPANNSPKCVEAV
jgi:putative SOS response-associated peptidase YedK